MFDWVAENTKDEELLGRIILSVLDASIADSDEHLATLIAEHNAALAEIRKRFGRVAADREAYVDHRRWLNCESQTIHAEHQRIAAETWDVLVALRRLLQQRQSILRQMEDVLANRMASLTDKRDRLANRLRRVLERQHTDYIRAQAYTGPNHLEQLIQENEEIVDLNRQIDALSAAYETVQTTRHRTEQGIGHLQIRQTQLSGLLN